MHTEFGEDYWKTRKEIWRQYWNGPSSK